MIMKAIDNNKSIHLIPPKFSNKQMNQKKYSQNANYSAKSELYFCGCKKSSKKTIKNTKK